MFRHLFLWPALESRLHSAVGVLSVLIAHISSPIESLNSSSLISFQSFLSLPKEQPVLIPCELPEPIRISRAGEIILSLSFYLGGWWEIWTNIEREREEVETVSETWAFLVGLVIKYTFWRSNWDPGFVTKESEIFAHAFIDGEW